VVHLAGSVLGELSRRLPSELRCRTACEEDGLVGKLEDVVVVRRRSAIREFRRPATTGLRKTSTTSRSFVTDHDGVALVGGVPDVARAVERDAVRCPRE
jgi:hypothetical protein